MANWRTTKVTEQYREITDIDSGAVRRIPFATDAQFDYLQSLRKELGKDPLKNRPAAYQAAKAIDKLLAKKAEKKQSNLAFNELGKESK